MQHLDLQVIEQALNWSRSGERVWLCTVLATYGSSPREPGSLLVARGDGSHAGSLSGGCVEEDFLERLRAGEFDAPVITLRYGGAEDGREARVALPCGGILKVLVERLEPHAATWDQLEILRSTLQGQRHLLRIVDLDGGETQLLDDDGLGARVSEMPDGRTVQLRVGPAARLRGCAADYRRHVAGIRHLRAVRPDAGLRGDPLRSTRGGLGKGRTAGHRSAPGAALVVHRRRRLPPRYRSGGADP